MAADSQRLVGIRALVTRPRERTEELCFLLEDEGAEVTCVPLLELSPPEDPRPLRYAAEHVDRFQWIAFASPSAVQAFIDALREAGTFGRLAQVKLGSVGPRTSRALRDFKLEPTKEAAGSGGMALFEVMKPELREEDDVLLPVAEQGRSELSEALEQLGARVTRVCAYRSSPLEPTPEQRAALIAAPPDVALFGSPRTVEAFAESLGEALAPLSAKTKWVAIGPTTAAAMKQHHLSVAAVAERPTPEGLVEAVVQCLATNQ